ncbi:hypothetical protein [Sphingomonas sp. RS2018]
MTIWPAVSLLFALAASPAWADASTPADAAAAPQHDNNQPSPPRRAGERTRPSRCATCANPSIRQPMTETPNRALMMIPASHLRPALPDWAGEDRRLAISPAIAMLDRRPPLPRY